MLEHAAEHVKQLASAEDPVEAEYLPEGHSLHVEISKALDTVEYVPIGHDVHTVAPADGEYVPATQTVHIEAPAAAEYVPAAHAVQVAVAEVFTR